MTLGGQGAGEGEPTGADASDFSRDPTCLLDFDILGSLDCS